MTNVEETLKSNDCYDDTSAAEGNGRAMPSTENTSVEGLNLG